MFFTLYGILVVITLVITRKNVKYLEMFMNPLNIYQNFRATRIVHQYIKTRLENLFQEMGAALKKVFCRQ